MVGGPGRWGGGTGGRKDRSGATSLEALTGAALVVVGGIRGARFIQNATPHHQRSLREKPRVPR